MADITLRFRLSEPGLPHNIALRGVVDDAATDSVAVQLFWRWDDEPDMKPQPLGKATAGNELAVPFDLKGRSIRVFPISFTAKGDQNVTNLSDAKAKLFNPSAPPELSNIAYNSGTNEVTADIAGNGGIGTIRLYRKQGSGDFTEIQTLAYTATGFTDTPPVDETYYYKVTQDGQSGESSTQTIVVSAAGSTTGTAPSALSAVYNSSPRQVELDWTNNGGTGSIYVERKAGFSGMWTLLTTLASSAVSYDDTTLFSPYNQIYFYRVSNTSATGFSNEADAYVPRE